LSRVLSALSALFLASCSYQVANEPPQAPDPFTAYTDKVPGKWVLLVDAEGLKAEPQAPELRCNQFGYPMDLSKPFVKLAASTFEKVADDVRPFDHQLSRAEIASNGFTGEIAIHITEFRPRVKVDGVLDATATADTEIAGTILVTKAGQRMLDVSEAAKGEGTRDAGIICGGAADALSDSSSAAMQDLVRKFAEQFANSHDIRNSVPGYAPQ